MMADATMQALERAIRSELRDAPGAVVWPRKSEDIPDDAAGFRLVYLSPEWAGLELAALAEWLDHLTRKWGQTRREFRNAIGFAIPDAVGAYRSIHLPRMGAEACGPVEFLKIEVAAGAAGKSAPERSAKDAGGLHQVMMAALAPHFRDAVSPEELAEVIGLGRVDCAGVMRRVFPLADIPRWFFTFLNLPRLRNAEPLRRAVAEGVARGVFDLTSGRGLLALDAEIDPADGMDEVDGMDKFPSGAYLVARKVSSSQS